MTFPRDRRGFTLIEVLVAMAVLATLSSGLLATTWALVGFARTEAEHMIADTYCHDVMWAIYRQDYDAMLGGESEASWEIDPEKHLPRVVSVDLFGREKTTYPLWRSEDAIRKPRCYVSVSEDVATSTKKIVALVKWYNGRGEQAHSNVVVRARWSGGSR